jgi:hypothetical protein
MGAQLIPLNLRITSYYGLIGVEEPGYPPPHFRHILIVLPWSGQSNGELSPLDSFSDVLD